MSGRQMLLAALAGVVILGTAAGLILNDGDGEAPVITSAGEMAVEREPATGTTEVVATTLQPVESLVEDHPDPVDEGCNPDPGIEVVASGHIEGFDPEDEATMGSAARVRFRLDAPGNQNLILFRLIHIEGNDLKSWQEVGGVDESELTFDTATSRLSGWFNLSNDFGGTGFENPEQTEVDMVYEAEANRLAGTVTHPDATFMLDLTAEEAMRDFFADPSCYPTPSEGPGP